MSEDPSIVSESFRFSGDVKIRKMQITTSAGFTLNIINQMIGVEIYEDLFAPFITMAVSLRESLDLINNMPLRGEETLEVEIATPKFEQDDLIFKGTFYIYKLSGRSTFVERNSTYTLFCISIEALNDLNIKHSKAYKGNIGEIASTIIKSDGLNTTKGVIIEPTKNTTKYVSNFWSPVKNLNYLTTNAVSAVDNRTTYAFFENRKGFNFVTLDYLYKQQPYQAFIDDNYVRDVNEREKTVRNYDREYQSILSLKVHTSFDSMAYMNKGTYASRMFAHDILRKKYYARDYAYLAEFPNIPHLNTNALYTQAKAVSPTNLIFNEFRHFAAHDGFPDTSNVQVMQSRNSAMQILRSSCIQISVFGRTDYTVGQKVYVKTYKPAPVAKKDVNDNFTKESVLDGTLSGFYLITAVNHVITRESHTCVMELCKDSFVRDEDRPLV